MSVPFNHTIKSPEVSMIDDHAHFKAEVVSGDTDEMIVITDFKGGSTRIITANVTTNGVTREEQFISLSHWGMH